MLSHDTYTNYYEHFDQQISKNSFVMFRNVSAGGLLKKNKKEKLRPFKNHMPKLPSPLQLKLDIERFIFKHKHIISSCHYFIYVVNSLIIATFELLL